jgi:hypothetical protein
MAINYPRESELEFILNYDVNQEPDGLINHLRTIWHWPDYFKWQERHLELHTGGWSENEDIIEALMQTLFWALYWEKSERGGHYYFYVPSKE